MTLEDGLWQLLTSQHKFTMLTIDRKTRYEMSPIHDPDLLHAFYLDLGSEVKVEKRKVLSILGAFGDLGGIYEFFSFFILIFIGRFPAKLLALDQVQTMFRTSQKINVL